MAATRRLGTAALVASRVVVLAAALRCDGESPTNVTPASRSAPLTELTAIAADGLADIVVISQLQDGRVLMASRNREHAVLYSPLNNTAVDAGALGVQLGAASAEVLLDGRVLIIGALDGGTLLYDPRAGQFSPGPSLPATHDAAMVRLADGRVLITGGRDSIAIGPPRRTAYVIDSAAMQAQRVGDMAVGRDAHCEVLLDDGTVIVAAGGIRRSSTTDLIERFDPTAGTFVDAGRLLRAVSNAACHLRPDGRVWVVGGAVMNLTGNINGVDDVSIYDPGAGVTTDAGVLRAGVFDMLTLQTPRDELWVAGGTEGSVLPVLAQTFTDDGVRRDATDLRSGRSRYNAMVLPTGRALIAGFDTITILEDRRPQWVAGPSLPRPRAASASLVMPDGELRLYGGRTDLGITGSAVAWRESGAWRTLPDVTGRERGQALLLDDGTVLLQGGVGADGGPVAPERVDAMGNTTALPLEGAPLGRAIVLADGDVLFTGLRPGQTGVLQYEVQTGRQTPRAPLPGPRVGHRLIRTSTGVLLVGGATGAPALEWDERTDTWTPITLPAARPPETAVVRLTDGRIGLFGSGATALAPAFIDVQRVVTASPQTETNAGGAGTVVLRSGAVLQTGATPRLFDPLTNRFASLPGDGGAPQVGQAHLLPSGRVVFAGGFQAGGTLDAVVLFDEGLQAPTAPAPTLTVSQPTVAPGDQVAVVGTRLRQNRRDSCASQWSTSEAVVLATSLRDGTTVTLPTAVSTPTAAVVTVPVSMPRDWYLVRAVVAGLASDGVALRVASPLGATCVSHVQCASGVCVSMRCTNPPDGGTDAGALEDGGFDGGDLDGGAADGGLGGEPERQRSVRYTVGCSCDGGSGSAGVLLVLALSSRRLRYRRDVDEGSTRR